MKKVWKFIEDWIWQLPQNLCGIIYKNAIKNDIISNINADSGYSIYLKKK